MRFPFQRRAFIVGGMVHPAPASRPPAASGVLRYLSPFSPLLAGLRPGTLPGLAFALLIAALAMFLAGQPWAQKLGLSALTLAIALGLVLGHTAYPALQRHLGPGVDWSKQKLLRLGIVLFGLRLSFQDIAAVGWVGVLADAGVLLSTFALALWLGRRWLKLDSQTALLIGAGSAICGAAAVLATEPVVKAPAAKVAIAVATVMVFGTLAMFLYPVLYALQRQLDVPGAGAWAFGIYTGSTVHEVAQVAAVGNAIGPDAAKSAVIAKMMRVLMLAPFLLGLSWMMARGEKTERGGKQGGVTVLPWFALGFVFMAGLRSLDLAWPWMPPAVLQALLWLGNLLLATAMAALGLSTHASVIHRAGGKPLLLGALLFAWLLVGGALLNAVVHALLG